MNKFKTVKNILQTIIFILVVTYIYFNVSFSELVKIFYFKENFIFLLLFYITIAFFTNYFQARRWEILIEFFKEKASFKQYLKIVTYSNLLAEISFFGIFTRALIRLYSKIRIVNVFISLLIEKFLSIYTLVFLSSISLIYIFNKNLFVNISHYAYYIYIFVFILIISPYVIIKITSINNLKFFERFRKFFFIFYFLRKEYFFKTFTNTLLIQLFAILKVFIVMKMFDLDVSLVEMIVLLPLINLFIAIPASITPWGWREFIFINILSYIGLTNEQSVLISLTNSVLLISVQFLFYLIFLRLR